MNNRTFSSPRTNSRFFNNDPTTYDQDIIYWGEIRENLFVIYKVYFRVYINFISTQISWQVFFLESRDARWRMRWELRLDRRVPVRISRGIAIQHASLAALPSCSVWTINEHVMVDNKPVSATTNERVHAQRRREGSIDGASICDLVSNSTNDQSQLAVTYSSRSSLFRLLILLLWTCALQGASQQ